MRFQKNMTKEDEKAIVLKKFRVIPGVGKSIAEDLWELGYRSFEDLKSEIPEQMYENFCSMVGMRVDRCLLYVFREVVYYVNNSTHAPDLLKWWNWKDK